MLRAVLERDVPILRMTSEELRLALERVAHALVAVDVPLRAVHDTDEAQLERVHTPREHVERVRARMHQVQLGEDPDRPPNTSLSESEVARSTFAGEAARMTLTCVCMYACVYACVEGEVFRACES